MLLSDIIKFRRDLLFQGAVQVGWLETDPKLAKMAAEHFVFHGPHYHGSSQSDFGDGGAYRLTDTASFAQYIVSHLVEKGPKLNPITLAVAGYGTGKSHFALTLAKLLSEPGGEVAKKIINNMAAADRSIAVQVNRSLANLKQPYLVIAINGMLDFDLSVEIIRQIFARLTERGIDTTTLEKLRPRFTSAQTFTINSFQAFKDDFCREFGPDCTKEQIVLRLKQQDEDAFIAVNNIFKRRTGQTLRAVTHESLQGFLSEVNRHYCGPGKAFAGVVIFFDEFGRYLEFAAKRPHIAGAGGLQQLFEAVQANSDSIMLVCFIQYELKAYASRIAPEARESLERYISRYDMSHKVRLSTNLETIIANLIEKKQPQIIRSHVNHIVRKQKPEHLVAKFRTWFPDIKNHALWNDPERFHQVIQEGCWPLHPAATWFLYRLSSVGKSLQQRSAMSFVDDVCVRHGDKEVGNSGWSIPPVELCTQDMIDEFLSSERLGQQGSVARAYESVLARYGHEITAAERKQLTSVLLATKIGLKTSTQADCLEALAMLSGTLPEITGHIIGKLTKEKGVLRWNEAASQFDILGDAVSVRDFLDHIERKVGEVRMDKRSQLFSYNFKSWMGLERFNTDFGASNDIDTAEWHFSVKCSNASLIEDHVKTSLTEWRKALGIDQCRGQLIYCYVGPESDLSAVRDNIRRCVEDGLQAIGLTMSDGAPLAVVLLDDHDGSFGESLAEYWVLSEQMQESESKKYANYIAEHKDKVHTQLLNKFKQLEKKHDLVLACDRRIMGNSLETSLPNLFDVLYHERIPFPFDKFQTTRGNAAKDCRLFTAELFMGNLNQSWISARNAREKNRAVRLLNDSWQIFEPDGTVCEKPKNPRVRRLIDFIDSKLREKDKVNLWELVQMLCYPPFGCNVASAGLLLGVFVAVRKDRLRFTLYGESIFIDNWLAKSLEKDLFNPSVLESTWVRYIPEDRMSRWQQLLTEWDQEKTYDGQISYWKQAEELSKEELVPEGLYYRWEMLRKRSLEAQKAVKEWNDTLQKQEALLERSIQRKLADCLAKCAAELAELLKSMTAQREAWTEKQIEITEKLAALALHSTEEMFAEWLGSQRVTDPTELSSFRQKMHELGKCLTQIGLQERVKQLQDRVNKVELEAERLIEIRGIIGSVKSFVQGHPITDGTRVNEIYSCLETIPKLRKTLKDSVGEIRVAQISEAMASLDELEKSCKKQMDDYENRVKNLSNGPLSSIDNVFDKVREVRSLQTIYDGRQTEFHSFQIMLSFLSLLEDYYDRMSSLKLSQDELYRTYGDMKREAEQISQGREVLPWGVEETCTALLREIEGKRRDHAARWMSKYVPDLSSIEALDSDLIQRLRTVLQSPPAFLSDDERKIVTEALRACNRRLDEMEVEGLLVRFRDLSREAQAEFLKRVRRLLTDG